MEPVLLLKLMPRYSEDLDLEREAHLLIWISQRTHKYGSLEQVCRSNRLLDILLIIDKDHFLPLKNQSQFSFAAYFHLIELYITQTLGKRLKRKLKTAILQSNYVSHLRLIQLLLYMSVHSNSKKKFIQQILSLPDGVQKTLMKVIDDIGEFIYVMQVAQILQKINSLEIQNQALEDHLEQKENKYSELMEKYKIISKDLEDVEKQNQSLKKQKNQLFKELNIDSTNDYLQVFRELNNQYNETLKSLIRSQQHQRSLSTDLKGLKSKIFQDSKLISQLQEEVDSLRQVCRNLRGLNISQTDQQGCPFFDSTNVLKQNKMFSNSVQMQSPKRLLKSSKLLFESQQDLQEEVLRLRLQVCDMSKKNEAYFQIMQSQKEILSTYKDDMIKLKRCNEIRKWKLQELQSIHNDLSKLVMNKQISVDAI